ncbi:MAG: hypothetical protein H7Z72_02315 [Bacteroidetes bacterium]|nr:hypothetical protein [Fibrella sp.]
MFTFPMFTKAKSLFAGCFLMTATLFANPIDPVTTASFNTCLYITKANKIHLAIEKITAAPITITLRPLGAGQPCIFRQCLGKKQAKLALRLDVSELVDGIYELEIKSATGQTIRQIELATPARQTEVTRRIVFAPFSGSDAVLSAK